jgi:hypothetical protein
MVTLRSKASRLWFCGRRRILGSYHGEGSLFLGRGNAELYTSYLNLAVPQI